MVKHFTKKEILTEVKKAISNSPHQSISQANGKAGLLLEHILGISGGNHDVADAVGFELKTSINANTPLTLFHKEALPRGSIKNMDNRFGWQSEYKGQHEVTSFRATIWGSWKSSRDKTVLNVTADSDKIQIINRSECVSYWDSNSLIGIAAAKLRNLVLVFAKDNKDGTISFTSALLLETFAPFNFLNAIANGSIAIDYDARTKPGSQSIRNHGTKFRIKERDLKLIYQNVTEII